MSKKGSLCGSKTRPAARLLFQAGRILVILVFLAGLIGLQASPAQAAATWTAFNDCVSGSGQSNAANTTTIACISASGALKDVDSGASTGVTAAFSSSGSPTAQSTLGVTPNSGTDAYALFNGKADMKGAVQYGSSSGWSITLTLSGLSADKTYTFATSSNRDGASDYDDRNTTFILSGDDGAVNASSSGVTVVNAHTIAMNTGSNTARGHIVRWTDIQPGSDGTVVITARPTTTAEIPGSQTYKTYGFSVFMLQEEGPSTPTIQTSGSLAAFQTAPGSPSPAQTYTVSASHLVTALSIAAPTGFELSRDGAAYSPSLSLAPDGNGAIPASPVYVRLAAGALGTYSGGITHTSDPAPSVSLPVSGTISNTVCSNVTLTAAADTYLSANDLTYNNGGNTSIHVDGTTGTSRRTALLRWDLSGIPVNATINTANLTFYVTDATTQAYNLYQMRQAWVEGTSTQQTSSTSANWNTYDGSHTWGTAGAANVDTDRFDTNLWNATASSFGTANASASAALNAAGLAALQGWVNHPETNFGFTLQNFSGSSSNTLFFSSREASTTANRPQMTVAYCVESGPSITTNGTLAAFNTTPGMPSAAQTYTVSARQLTTDLHIAAPAGFELSTDASAYSDALTLGVDDYGTVAATTVYVRLSGAVQGDLSGDIVHTGGGAAQVNLPVSGTANNCQSASFYPVDDTYLSGVNTTYNYGASTTLRATIDSDNPRSALFRWDLSSIPAGATVSDASFSLSISSAAAQVYNLYNMRQAWVEGTGAREDTGDGATWETYDGVSAWGTNGAASTSVDRYDTNLWTEDATSFASTGVKTVALNPDGIAAVQGWIDAPANNHGVTIQNFTGSASAGDDLQFDSVESDTQANRPRLNLTYCVDVSTPYINLSTAALSFDAPANQFSAEQSYLVTGANLTGPVDLAVSGNFQISAVSGSAYGPALSLFPLDGSLNARVYVRMFALPVGPYSGAVTHSGGGISPRSLALNGSAVNTAPAAPALFYPGDASNGVPIPAGLSVTPFDLNGDPLDVSFYGRTAGAGDAPDFMLVLLPDIQNESQNAPNMLTEQMEWIVGNQAVSNIAFVTSLGDLVNSNNSAAQYQAASDGFEILDDAGIPYSVGPGNHDLQIPSTSGSLYNTYFGVDRFSGKPWYGGHFGEPTSNDNANNYSLFSASGNDFILINLQYSPTPAQLDWADALLKQYSNRRGIVEQHNLLNTNNDWNSQGTYDALRDNPNLFLMVCGHMHASNDGAAYVLGSGTDGHTIHVVMADYQDMSNGNGWLRLLRFSPAHDMIYMTTYSPFVETSITTSPDQMDLAYDLNNAGGGPFSLIGTNPAVLSGQTTSLAWTGLADETSYEWYAAASDGHATTQSNIWSFTTGIAGANHAPLALPDSYSVVQGSSLNVTAPFGVLANDSDADLDPLTAVKQSDPAHGTLNLNASGAFTYTPAAEYNGPDSFTYTANDGQADSAVETVSINVTKPITPLQPPSSFYGQMRFADGNPALGTVITAYVPGASNPVGTTQVALYGGQPGYMVDVLSDDSGTDAKDGGLEGDPITFRIGERIVATAVWHSGTNVLLDFHPPQALPGTGYSGNAGLPVDFTANANDLGSDAQTYAWDWNNDGVYDSFGRTLSHTFAAGGLYPVGLKVTDAQGGEGKASVIVSVNTPPVLQAIPAQSIGEGSLLSFSASASDADDDALVFSLDGAPSGAAITTAGAFTWTPSETQGPGNYNFDVCVTDSLIPTPLCAPVSVAVSEVNTAPVLAAISAQNIAEGSQLSFTASATDADLPRNTLVFSLDGAPTGAAITAAGAFTWTPGEAQGPDDYSFAVCVTDQVIAAPLCASVSVAVSEVNTAPTLAAIPAQSVDEGSLLHFTASATDPDLPATGLEFSLAGDVPQGAAITPAGAFTWTPAVGLGGSDFSFQVCVTDHVISAPLCTPVSVTVRQVIASQTLALVPGWNLVSFYVHPANPAPAAILSGISGQYDLVYAWDAASATGSHWLKYDPTPGAEIGNSLTQLDEGLGFWIHMNSAANLVINGTMPTTTTIVLSDNAGGWNLVGYPSTVAGTLPEILTEHGVGEDQITLVYAYHAADSADPWKLFDPHATMAMDLTEFTPGWGYWIEVTADGQWTVNYSGN